MLRKAYLAVIFAFFAMSVSCTQPQQHDRPEECKAMARLPHKDSEIVICSQGDRFSSKKAGQWSGDNIVIFKQRGKDRITIRDFTETAFGSTYGVFIEANDGKLLITIFTDCFPDWEVGPLMTEIIDLDSGASVITPQVPVPKNDPGIVEKLWEDINKRQEDMFPGEVREDERSRKFILLVYGNMFKLRDHGFRNPEVIEKKLRTLRKWDWNDGEVAEVYSHLLSHVTYMKGKQVKLNK